MTDIIHGERKRHSTLHRAALDLWQVLRQRRARRRQRRIVEDFDDFRRRDIGLPPRGAPVRQVHFYW